MSNVDFTNKSFLKLNQCDNDEYMDRLRNMLGEGERIISSYKSIRDGVVFTTDRFIALNIQGLTGKKTAYTFVPYSKVSAYAVESAGHLDLDGELTLWVSGLGSIYFEFTGSSDISKIVRALNQ